MSKRGRWRGRWPWSGIRQWVALRMYRMSLFQRSMLLGMVLVVALFGIVAFVTNQASRSLEDRILQERLAATEAAAGALSQVIRHSFAELEGVAQGYVSRDGELPSHHDGSARSLSSFHGFTVVDLEGRTLTPLHGDAFPGTGTLARLVTSEAASERLQQGRFVLPAVPARDREHPWVIMGTRVRQPSGPGEALLLGSLDLASLRIPELLRSTVAALRTGHGDILEISGSVLASTEDGGVLGPGDHPGFYAAMQDNPHPVVRSAAHEEGDSYHEAENHVIAYVPLGPVPWALSVGGSEGETLAPVYQFRRRIVGVAAFAAGLAVVGGVIGFGRLVRPVKQLSLAARRMAGGELEEPVRVREGGEIGELALDMDRMRMRLKTSLDDLQEMNEDLEQRIVERTGELEALNRELIAASAIAEKVSGSSVHLRQTLEQTLESVAEATGHDSLAVFLLDDEGRRLTLTAGRSLPPPFRVAETSVLVGSCLCGAVAATGESAVVPDARHSALITRSACSVAGFFCVASFPLRSRERVEGVLNIFSSEPHSLSKRDFGVVELICTHIGIAIHNARLYGETERRKTQVQQLLQRVINAQEEERRRLARELHDETGQSLTAIAIGLNSIKAILPREWREAREDVGALQETTKSAIAELRRMALALRPSALDDLGLVPAVRQYVAQHLSPAGVSVRVDAPGFPEALNPGRRGHAWSERGPS